MKKLLIALFTTFVFSAVRASDTLVVHKDVRLDILTSKQIAVNKLTAKMTSNGQYRGYRLQVLNSNSRDEAFKTKAQLLQLFPDQKSYVMYKSPYFKVRIGNFIEREDAVSFRDKMSKKYPQNAYIVEDIIEYTPTDDEPVAN